MNAETVKLEIISDYETMEEIRAAGLLGDGARFIERRDLVGDPNTWITLATAGVNLAVAIVTLLGKRVDGRSIRKIKIGGIELENPTREDLEVLRNRIAATQARE